MHQRSRKKPADKSNQIDRSTVENSSGLSTTAKDRSTKRAGKAKHLTSAVAKHKGQSKRPARSADLGWGESRQTVVSSALAWSRLLAALGDLDAKPNRALAKAAKRYKKRSQ
jgi:hypothetical protein